MKSVMSGISLVSRRFRLRSWFVVFYIFIILKLLGFSAFVFVFVCFLSLGRFSGDNSISVGCDFYIFEPPRCGDWNVEVAEGREGPPGWRSPRYFITSFLCVRRRMLEF